MASVGDRFKTGEKSPTRGDYTFDGYTSGPATPVPTSEEQRITLDKGEVFPPIKSTNRGAHWKLARIF